MRQLEEEIFLFSSEYRLAVGPYEGCGMKLTIYTHLVMRLRMNGAVLPLPHVSSTILLD
jgi:hypothetical protein